MVVNEIEQRMWRLERAVLALADAVAQWDGGTREGTAYASARWADKVRDAVKAIQPPRPPLPPNVNL
jgi:hypothetical protein